MCFLFFLGTAWDFGCWVLGSAGFLASSYFFEITGKMVRVRFELFLSSKIVGLSFVQYRSLKTGLPTLGFIHLLEPSLIIPGSRMISSVFSSVLRNESIQREEIPQIWMNANFTIQSH